MSVQDNKTTEESGKRAMDNGQWTMDDEGDEGDLLRIVREKLFDDFELGGGEPARHSA